MNTEKARIFSYLASVSVFIILVVVAMVKASGRLEWLSVAFAVLAVGWLIERSFTRVRPLQDLAVKVHRLGFIHIDGQLTVSDQLALSDAIVICDIPEGEYAVHVETRRERDGCYVSAVQLNTTRSSIHQRSKGLVLLSIPGF